MTNKPNPVAGQRLWSLNIGNAARHCEQKLTEVFVSKVGRKYFECCKVGNTPSRYNVVAYHLGTWREKTEFCENSHLYSTKQEWEDAKEEKLICSAIAKAFEYGNNKRNISLDVLREIAARLP